MKMLLDPPIVMQGELSKEDVLTADRMLTPRRKRTLRTLACVVLVALVFAVWTFVRPHDEAISDGVFFGGMLGVGFAMAAPAWLNRYRIHQAWKQKTGVFQTGDTTITPDGLTMRVPGAVSQIEWSMFFAAMQRPKAVILFYQGGWMLFARSRFPNGHDWDRFTAFVRQQFDEVTGF